MQQIRKYPVVVKKKQKVHASFSDTFALRRESEYFGRKSESMTSNNFPGPFPPSDVVGITASYIVYKLCMLCERCISIYTLPHMKVSYLIDQCLDIIVFFPNTIQFLRSNNSIFNVQIFYTYFIYEKKTNPSHNKTMKRTHKTGINLNSELLMFTFKIAIPSANMRAG